MTTENQPKPEIKRLYSLDALRGFDMFWSMGGAGMFIGLASLTGWPVLAWWAHQLDHVPWDGFHFYDMVFPCFLFVAGISFPFSMAKRTALGESRRSIYWHVISRGLILAILGVLCNNAVRFDFASLRYGSVLGRIGLAWMFAALIFMNTKLRFRIAWFWGLIIVYWLLLLLFPAHDLGSKGPFSVESNFVGYIDRLLMPGKLYFGIYEPEGILGTIPAIATAMLGMLTGEFVMSEYLKTKPLRKVLCMLLAAIGLIIIGKIWDIFCPINKNLWSSSFVCFVGGLSLLLFALFYLVIDVWNCRKWAFFFAVIGMNAITIYLAARIINFNAAMNFVFGGVIGLFPRNWFPFLDGVAITAIGWIFLYFLYRKKIFLKV